MQLYQYAVYRAGNEPKILVDPTTIVALDEDEAKIIAHRAIPEAEMEELANVRVVVRPF